jgi:hypothetical protein
MKGFLDSFLDTIFEVYCFDEVSEEDAGENEAHDVYDNSGDNVRIIFGVFYNCFEGISFLTSLFFSGNTS